MKKRTQKTEGDVGVTCVAGWKNDDFDSYIKLMERDVKWLAKAHNLQINVFVTVWPLPEKRKSKK